MTIFLTSSPTGPLDNSRIVHGVDTKNNFIQQLHTYWKPHARCLYITASPADFRDSDMACTFMEDAFRQSAFPISVFDCWDNRTTDFSRERLHSYDVIILGGGHVPTQLEFFHRIGLRETIAGFDGIVIGISAGSMDCADIVYAQPEHPGETLDPNYNRFPVGLGLAQTNVLPHYQMVKDFRLDGKRLYEDITYGDSYGRDFIVLPDGSYILIAQGQEQVFGEAYRLRDAVLEQICWDNQSMLLK